MTDLDKELSDHSPVLLSSAVMDFGPSPFRFSNSWMIISACANFKGYGCSDSFFATKLRYLKKAIKDWSRKEFGKEQQNLNQIKNRVKELDTFAETRPLTEAEFGERREGFQKIGDMERALFTDLKQKARIRWAVDGDKNTKFFRTYVNNKNRKNQIT